MLLLKKDTAAAQVQLRQAADCARGFDEAPDFRLQGIRFYRGGEEVLSDSMGETAMDALRGVISQATAVREGLQTLLASCVRKG